jgi:hypothetical protein
VPVFSRTERTCVRTVETLAPRRAATPCTSHRDPD